MDEWLPAGNYWYLDNQQAAPAASEFEQLNENATTLEDCKYWANWYMANSTPELWENKKYSYIRWNETTGICDYSQGLTEDSRNNAHLQSREERGTVWDTEDTYGFVNTNTSRYPSRTFISKECSGPVLADDYENYGGTQNFTCPYSHQTCMKNAQQEYICAESDDD
tara:strand:- start:31 stop:531 length:501 start_codon:yes stop_codon:yes gene_type:complete